MSGLRSHREYTITCVSLRSGIASSGMVRMDHQPAATAAATSVNTTSLLRPENSMIVLIMRERSFELRFGIDQKRSGGDDALARTQAAQDLDPIVDAVADFDGARLQTPVALIDKHRLP